jgi:hypothetical protein
VAAAVQVIFSQSQGNDIQLVGTGLLEVLTTPVAMSDVVEDDDGPSFCLVCRVVWSVSSSRLFRSGGAGSERREAWVVAPLMLDRR